MHGIVANATSAALQQFTSALQPVELYTFSCADFEKEDRIVPAVDESFLGTLKIFNADLFTCHSSGQGILPRNFQNEPTISRDTVPLIESENSVSSLFDHLMSMEEPGISIELWFTPSSVNDTVSLSKRDEHKCRSIREKKKCDFFAKSTYIQGPISCTWYEGEGRATSNDSISHIGREKAVKVIEADDAYCGFPGNRFAYHGESFNPMNQSLQTCSDSAKTKEGCERSHFFEPIPCFWEDDSCHAKEPDSMAPLRPRFPLLSIGEGDHTKIDRSIGCPGTGHNYDFRIAQKGRAFSVSHSGYDMWTCNYSYNPMEMMLSQSPKLTQVVVTMNNKITMSTSVFMNGGLVDKKPKGYGGSGAFRDWNPTMFLQLFSDYDTLHVSEGDFKYIPPFLGSIHLLAIYDRCLSNEDVKLAHRNGRLLLSTM